MKKEEEEEEENQHILENESAAMGGERMKVNDGTKDEKYFRLNYDEFCLEKTLDKVFQGIREKKDAMKRNEEKRVRAEFEVLTAAAAAKNPKGNKQASKNQQ